MHISKFEAIGIALSIVAMVLALYVVRLQTTDRLIMSAGEENTPSDTIFIADGENQRAAVADALLAAREGGEPRLIADDIVFGDGLIAEEGDTVTVHYIGTLQNGQRFDDTYERGEPFTFKVGSSRVIEGWNRGIVGMRAGGQRVLVIPPELAYGDNEAGPIPENATLVFAVELIAVEK